MKSNERPCVVLCDYPLKARAYLRLLAGLGQHQVQMVDNFDFSLKEAQDAKLVVFDMNILSDIEQAAINRLEQDFPRANILFLQEDHCDMQVRFSNQRDICCLGKLSENNVLHGALRELLLRADATPPIRSIATTFKVHPT